MSDLAHAERSRVPYMDLIADRLADEQEEAAALEKYATLPILMDDAWRRRWID